MLDHGASLVSCPKVILADCVESILEGVPAILSRYLAAGADPNLPDANSCTLLHIAAAEKSLLAVKMLVQAGANVLLEDRFGHQPIDTAKRFKANNVVQFLQPAVNKALATSRVKSKAKDTSDSQVTVDEMVTPQEDVREAPFLPIEEGERQQEVLGWVTDSAWRPLASNTVQDLIALSPSVRPPDEKGVSFNSARERRFQDTPIEGNGDRSIQEEQDMVPQIADM